MQKGRRSGGRSIHNLPLLKIPISCQLVKPDVVYIVSYDSVNNGEAYVNVGLATPTWLAANAIHMVNVYYSDLHRPIQGTDFGIYPVSSHVASSWRVGYTDTDRCP